MNASPPPPSVRPPRRADPFRVVSVDTLFGAGREIRIQFRQDEYRLRITKNEKLILTK